jgi:hypothetical protein
MIPLPCTNSSCYAIQSVRIFLFFCFVFVFSFNFEYPHIINGAENAPLEDAVSWGDMESPRADGGHAGGDDRAPLLPHRAFDHDDMSLLAPSPRRTLWRMRRADLACLTVMGLVASFLMVWQPPERPMGSLTRTYANRDYVLSANKQGERSPQAATYKYMTYDDISAEKRKTGYDVTYTERGFTVDGRTTLLLGGSIHYSRSTPGMWEDLLRKAKNDGLNHVEMCTFLCLRVGLPWRESADLGLLF